MCGIFGVAVGLGRRVELGDAEALRLRDTLSHRGPDGAGLWRDPSGQFLLTHRRLAVLDPSPAGAQPMLLGGDDGATRWAIAYNGELYNDVELRQELKRLGVTFRTRCDTETVLRALQEWGAQAIPKLRGIFALAAVDVTRRRLVLARDSLGIKPLYWWTDGRQVVFASEPGVVASHPDVGARPDLVTVSAYLSTIRTVLGERTLFEGIRTVLPGEVIEIGFGEREDGPRVLRSRVEPAPASGDSAVANAADVRAMVVDSISRHLRSDVPACSLLSGGLDSSIIVAACRELGVDHLRTYSSGHDDGSDSTDPAFARRVASAFGTTHTEAPVTRELFAQRWPEMVARQGVPLSTPNEVAINEVARRLRADGQVVALSGEGADELFGGYELPMRQAWEFEESGGPRGSGGSRRGAADGGLFQLRSNAWIAPEMKAAILRPEIWRAVEQDVTLEAWYTEEFAALRQHTSGVQTHLSFHRRVNLAGLLQRLDTATMLEGVEGRTPFADVAVAAMAEALPMDRKFVLGTSGPSRTKIALREAFASVLPLEVVERPKASFPLPFQAWVEDQVPVLRRSALARELFNEAAIETVCAEPAKLWNLAWPMINLAMWGERW